MTHNYIILLVMVKYVLSMRDINYTVYHVTAYNTRERALLHYLNMKRINIVFLNGVTNEAALPMNIAVESSAVKDFEDILDSYNIQYNYGNPKNIRNKLMDPDRSKKSVKNSFLDWDSIVEWLQSESRINPYLEIREIGHTKATNRPLYSAKISAGRVFKKPAIMVVGGESGRDWITTAVILNFMNYLLGHAGTEQFIERFDFYFVPVANPDGYVLSYEDKRFWSKNTQLFPAAISCKISSSVTRRPMGVNLDKNWMEKPSASAGQSECQAVFPGKSLCEETMGIMTLLNEIAAQLMAFVSLKGFTRLIATPYAKAEKLTNNNDLMMEILSAVTERLKTNFNANYYYGTTARLFYNYTGNMADWVKDKLNVPIVYTVYLQQDDNFIPATNDIQPLTQQFISILSHTLSIAGNVYGPLFNSAAHAVTQYNTTILYLLMVHFYIHFF